MQRCAARVVKHARALEDDGSDDGAHGDGDDGDDDPMDGDSGAPPPPPPGGGGGTAPDGRIHLNLDDGSQIRYYPATKPFFEFLTLRVSPPAHPETMPRRIGPETMPIQKRSRIGPSWTLQSVAAPPAQVQGRGLGGGVNPSPKGKQEGWKGKLPKPPTSERASRIPLLCAWARQVRSH